MKPESPFSPLNILLADDDTDDCLFFENALKEIPIKTQLTVVHDGEQLMKYLLQNSSKVLEPYVIFLDLNMPRKNGFECLTEIKENEKLKHLPVVMFSTSYQRDFVYERDIIKMLFKIGALDYIRKSENLKELTQIISNVLALVEGKKIN